jgi:hypothetical protein
VSVNTWDINRKAAAAARRSLEAGPLTVEDHKRRLNDVVPGLNERQLEKLAQNHVQEADLESRLEENCAPSVTMDCLFKNVGARFKDY